ncbi:MAG TPA: hypothetical protein DGM69_05175 [Chloroflexi bacterium]|nr:hypothetical protein [Chloroflexota bacterium]|tara:strand:+ start:5443 stop:6891 length:1449 start_codon:yes stop_codon:yes gene_type:complete
MAMLILGAFLAMILVQLPVYWGFLLVLTLTIIAAAVYEPIIALCLGIVFGPSRALLSTLWPELPLYPGQILFLIFFLTWLFRFVMIDNGAWKVSSITKFLMIYLFICLLSMWGALDLSSAIKEMIKWIQILIIIFVISNYGNKTDITVWILFSILLSGLLQSIIGFWQFMLRGTGPESFSLISGLYRAYGTFEQPNPFGGYMGIVCPIAAVILCYIIKKMYVERNTHKFMFKFIFVLIVLLSSITSLIVSYSRGAWVGAFAAFFVMLTFLPIKFAVARYIVFSIVGLGLLAFNREILPDHFNDRIDSIEENVIWQDVRRMPISESNYSMIERAAHWQAAQYMLVDNPWLGVGLGNYEVAYSRYQLPRWETSLGHAHNYYLNVAAETGLIGFIAFVSFWIYVLYRMFLLLRNKFDLYVWLTLGLLGVWIHISVHNLVDNLFVNNIHLAVGSLLGVLSLMELSSSNDNKLGDVFYSRKCEKIES